MSQVLRRTDLHLLELLGELSHFWCLGLGFLGLRPLGMGVVSAESAMSEKLPADNPSGPGNETEALPNQAKLPPDSSSVQTSDSAGGSSGSAGGEKEGAGAGDGGKGGVSLQELHRRALRTQLESGKPLTNEQWRQLESERGGAEVGRWVKTQAELGAALACDRRSIARYMDTPGNPGRTADGRYEVQPWRDFAAKHGRLRVPAKSDEEKAKLRQLNAEAELAEIRLLEARGQSVPLDEAMRVFGDIFAGLVRQMRALRYEVAPNMVGLPVEDAMEMLDGAVCDVMKDVSLSGEVKKKAFWRTIAERSSLLQETLLCGNGASGG